MLEKPDIQDEKIIACLQVEYELPIIQIAFLHSEAIYARLSIAQLPKMERRTFVNCAVVTLTKFLLSYPGF